MLKISSSNTLVWGKDYGHTLFAFDVESGESFGVATLIEPADGST